MATFSAIGKSITRIDAPAKVTGKAEYCLNLKLPGMLYCKLLRSPYPHARIISINTSRAEKLEGVRAVITGKDFPGERWGFAYRDRSVLARDVVRLVGEAVAAVAADSVEAAEEALGLIEVGYEELPAVFDPEEAMKGDCPVVIHREIASYYREFRPFLTIRFDPGLPNVAHHHQIRHGDVEKGFREADLVMENRFSAARIAHCAMEPHNAIARPESDGTMTVWFTTTKLHRHKADLCRVTGLPPTKVRLIVPYIGGNYGSRFALTVAAVAMLLASKTGKPVKLVMDREEVFIDGNTREPMVIYIKDGVRKDGVLLAREMRVILNAGAYIGIAPQVARDGAFGAVGTYRVPNFKLDSYAVVTNTPPVGPFAGFGSTEIIWAVESHMDMIAGRLNIDPIDIRHKNVLKVGERDVCGQITDCIAAEECLDKVAEWIKWNEKPPEGKGPWKRGKGVALCNRNTNAGMTSVVNVKVHPDGAVEIFHSAHETGQGCHTVLAQIAAEEFHTSMDKIKQVCTDTAFTPFEFGTLASRTTHDTGNALRLACHNVKKQMFQLAAARLEVRPEQLDIKDGEIYAKAGGLRKLKIADLFSPEGYLSDADKSELTGSGEYTSFISKEDPETGQGEKLLSYFSHGASGVEVAVNVDTGEVKVLRVGGCFEMGQPINPRSCEAQIEFGMGVGIGSALYEEMSTENGVVVNPTFLDYCIPTSMEIPAGENAKSMLVIIPHEDGPFGAKGFSEGACIPVAPAIGNAIYNATGIRVKDLPITRVRILGALRSGQA